MCIGILLLIILFKPTLYHERKQSESENVPQTVPQYIKGNWLVRRIRYYASSQHFRQAK
jgi:hypothetical protein